MSYASEHPTACARKDDLGCTASVPGSRWSRMAAQDEGWFFSYQEEAAYCPAHNPPWVAGWRARKKDQVNYALERLPAIGTCDGCDWTERADSIDEVDLMQVRSAARVHAQTKRHRTHVTTAQDSSYTPAELLAAAT